uniref:Retrotransposon protein n=1 Tax=Panagrellus redivivus TaxID=6233 RepID=A0A7E4VJY6_PANRE
MLVETQQSINAASTLDVESEERRKAIKNWPKQKKTSTSFGRIEGVVLVVDMHKSPKVKRREIREEWDLGCDASWPWQGEDGSKYGNVGM